MGRVLVIGNKNYSSWSLRAWLAARHAGLDFEEVRLPLDTEEFRARIGDYSPAGRVPVWIEDDLAVWESLAIVEHLADQVAHLWPDDRAAKARCRVAAAEMHAGFAALRAEMPMNLRATDRRIEPSSACERDVERARALMTDALEASGGPWLFGRFSVADAMWAPVIARFRTYGVAMEGALAGYAGVLAADPAMAEWTAAALEETEIVEADEAGA